MYNLEPACTENANKTVGWIGARIVAIAYTRYVSDGRVRRHAEALARRGDHADAIALGDKAEIVNGVNLVQVSMPRYRGASHLRYAQIYLSFGGGIPAPRGYRNKDLRPADELLARADAGRNVSALRCVRLPDIGGPDPNFALASYLRSRGIEPCGAIPLRTFIDYEILKTLDENGKHRGLRFVPEMFDYCMQRYRVLKRVERICIENTPDVRRLKNTVLLEGGICKGGGIGCDRACFHFWREIWLRRVSRN